jgi:hypothetical protein
MGLAVSLLAALRSPEGKGKVLSGSDLVCKNDRSDRKAQQHEVVDSLPHKLQSSIKTSLGPLFVPAKEVVM